jgi:hypothetical protein
MSSDGLPTTFRRSAAEDCNSLLSSSQAKPIQHGSSYQKHNNESFIMSTRKKVFQASEPAVMTRVELIS